MFQTPASRTSIAPIGRTLSCAPSGGCGSDEDDKENRCPNKDPPAEPNVDERKRNQKRLRDDEEGQSGVQNELESPGKKLEPRQLTYPEDDALGGIASMRDDNQEEVVPLTQPYPPESPQPASQEQQQDSQEEGECSPDSQLAIAG